MDFIEVLVTPGARMFSDDEMSAQAAVVCTARHAAQAHARDQVLAHARVPRLAGVRLEGALMCSQEMSRTSDAPGTAALASMPRECQWCGMIHSKPCPFVKAISYHHDGTVERVEFWPQKPETSIKPADLLVGKF